MPSSVPTADAPAGANDTQEPPPQDGWPGGLAALRAELDRIDDAIHDLLIERAGVVEHVARSGKPSAFRPGREASIIRRLVARHTGHLPRQTLFRIWREMLAGTTSMQAPMVIAVCDPSPGAAMTQLAREHFGALTPLRAFGSAAQALTDVASGTAAVAVLPLPSESDSPRDAWWTGLPAHEPRLHVIARLPFWATRPDGTPAAQALVVGAAFPDASEQDRSLLVLELDADVSRARLAQDLAAAGLAPDTMVVMRPYVLVEVVGLVADDDPRLGQLPYRTTALGGYAVPVQGA